MEQYIDKSALVAEIKRIMDEQQEICKADVALGKAPDSKNIEVIYQFQQFTKFLDTLEVKEIGVDIDSPEGGYNNKTVQFIDADGNIKEIIFNKAQNGKSALEAAKEEKVDNQNCVKPVDKVEPKFKIEKDKCYVCIRDLDDNYGTRAFCKGSTYYSTKDETLLPDNSNVPFEIKYCVNDYFHLWTIKDAKEGDVLHSSGFHNDCIFIFNGLDNWRFDEPNGDRAVATGYCCLSVSADNMEFGIQGPDCIEVDTVKPATKIQRDLLFQKMKEVGYEWDAEKKELKKIGQKPIDIQSIEKRAHEVFPDDDENTPLYRQAFIDGAIDYIDCGCKNTAWSEEDEYTLGETIQHLEELIRIDKAKHCACNVQYYQRDIDWLKSLKDRYTWKPSDEQMKILNEVLNFAANHESPHWNDYIFGTLNNLIRQLKKLREK